MKMDLRVGTELTCPVGRPHDRLDRSEGKGEADRIEWNYPALDGRGDALGGGGGGPGGSVSNVMSFADS